MKIKITAGGIYGADGAEIPIGTEFTVKEEPTAWAGRYEVTSGLTEGKTALINPAKYEAKADGDKFVIVDAKGKAVGKPITEADVAAFNSLSDEDKAAFVAANK